MPPQDFPANGAFRDVGPGPSHSPPCHHPDCSWNESICLAADTLVRLRRCAASRGPKPCRAPRHLVGEREAMIPPGHGIGRSDVDSDGLESLMNTETSAIPVARGLR